MGITNSSDYSVKPNDEFFFDANAWLHIYAPLSEYNKVKQDKYSSFFQKVIDRDAIVWVSLMVVSEIANVIVRDRFKKHKEKTNNHSLKYKDFWASDEKVKAVADSKSVINEILDSKYVQPLTDSFNSMCINGDLDGYYGKLDFNDAVIAKLCLDKNYTILTEDRDFQLIPSLKIIN